MFKLVSWKIIMYIGKNLAVGVKWEVYRGTELLLLKARLCLFLLQILSQEVQEFEGVQIVTTCHTAREREREMK